MNLRLDKSRKVEGASRGEPRMRNSITSIDIVVQALFTLIVLLRLWMGWDFTLQVLMWLVVAVVYGAPGAVAVWRGHPARLRIVALNGLLGWTGIGWIAALFWSTRRYDRPAAAL